MGAFEAALLAHYEQEATAPHEQGVAPLEGLAIEVCDLDCDCGCHVDGVVDDRCVCEEYMVLCELAALYNWPKPMNYGEGRCRHDGDCVPDLCFWAAKGQHEASADGPLND